jgi:transposase-like protein
MGFLDYDVEISKIIRSTNAIESLNATTDAPCEPEDTSRPNKPRSSASTSSPARWTDRPDAARHAGSPDASMTTAT